ncbi:GDP-mannose 4,6-dehydratase [Patescibacteria group bacterium]|nr:GDP-mannose 4,6-dehydratase [Patescibacteria group bacterium]
MALKRVLIIGGSGFIGSHIVDALAERAERITVIDSAKSRWKNKAAKYKIMDLRDEKLHKIFAKEKPDTVFHLAAHIHDRESIEEPVKNAEVNIIGSLNVFEAARRYLTGRLIFASTGVVYGHQDTFPIEEEALPRPLTPYAVSKLTGERYLNFYQNVYNLPYVALRLGNVYGPRQDTSAESGAIGIFATQLMKGEQAYINNDGLTTRDYVYIDDVVRAFIIAAESDYIGVLNIGTGRETSTNSIFELTRQTVGVQAAPEYREEIKDVVKRIALDANKARAELRWEPTVSVEEGVEKTVNWYRENI